MQCIKLTKENIEYLKDKYPELNYSPEENLIRGLFYFCRHYQGESIDSIYDVYQIEINLNILIEKILPTVRETAGRILKIALDKGLKPADLHINDNNGEMCLIIPPKIKETYPNGFDLKEYLKHVEEHLYWISYYEKFDKEPWPAQDHFDDGYLQLYLENKEKYYWDVKKHFSKIAWHEFRRKFKEYKKRKKL